MAGSGSGAPPWAAPPSCSNGTLEVIRLSVQDGKSWVKTWISRQCYDWASNDMVYNSAWMNITNLPYVLSADDNKVIVLGCNSMAYMRSDSVSSIDKFSSFI
jgi:hypothetical protein